MRTTMRPQPGVIGYTFEKFPIGVYVARPNKLEALRSRHMEGVIDVAQLGVEHSQIVDQLIYSLRSFLLKKDSPTIRTVTVETPATWFDHLKHDLLNGKNRFAKFIVSKLSPPKYKYKSENFPIEMRMCPHNNSYLTDDMTHVRFLSYTMEGGL